MGSQPLVIVTPCLNRAGMIAAIESVRDQDYGGEIEHLVMDGGSTDGTLETLARYPHVAVLSGDPDEGLYDALNKGVARARGAVVGLLVRRCLSAGRGWERRGRALGPSVRGDGMRRRGNRRARWECRHDHPAV